MRDPIAPQGAAFSLGVSRRRTASLFVLAVCGALALGGCAGAPPQNFDLHAASARSAGSRGTISIDLPTAAPPLDSDLLVVRESEDRLSSLPGAQWADRLTLLVQNRTAQTFENAGLLRKLRGSGEPADHRLSLEIRRFDIDAPTRLARVEISAKVVADGGRVVAARIFTAVEPVEEIAGAVPPQALDRALGRLLPQIVAWVAAAG